MDIKTIAQFYQQLDKTNLHRLDEIYHPDVVFEDSVHQIKGLESLLNYFASLYQNVDRCQFSIAEQHQTGVDGFLTWTMHLQHPRLSKGHPIDVKGMSHVKFSDGKVIYHRDYFDLGEMLYEHIPLLGSVIRGIKRRLKQ